MKQPARVISKTLPLIALTAVFLFKPVEAFAEILINEFAAITDGTTSDPDWVEIYNSGSEAVSLDGWLIRDSSVNNKINLSGSICPQKFRLFALGDYLNLGGDTIKLIDDNSTLIDEISYFSSDILVHTKGQSTGRSPDGAPTWSVFETPTLTDNSCETVPTVTLVPTPTPTASQTSPTATLQIKEVKDEEGNELSSVKVYLDDVYLHHYAPETLTFCDQCRCDDLVDCGFGHHEIRLEKSGYEDWTQTREINAGDNLEIYPIMILVSSENSSLPTSSPTPTFKPTPTPTRKTTPTPSLTPSPTGAVLGEGDVDTFLLGQTPTPDPNGDSDNPGKGRALPLIFLASSLIFLFTGSSWLWYTQFTGKA